MCERYCKIIGCGVYILTLAVFIVIGVYGVMNLDNGGKYDVLLVSLSAVAIFLMVIIPGILYACIPCLKRIENNDEESYDSV